MALVDLIAASMTRIAAEIKAVRAIAVSPKPYTAPSTAWQHPSNIVSTGAAGPSTGVVTFSPLDVGPAPLAINALGIQCTTAVSGGSVTYTLGLYKDDGSGGAPLLTSAGLLASGGVTATLQTLSELRQYLSRCLRAGIG